MIQDAVHFEVPFLPMAEPPHAPGSAEGSARWDLHDAGQHTADHLDCAACRAADDALQSRRANVGQMRFSEAAPWWMRLREQNPALKARTHDATQGCLDALGKFFAALRLCDITPGHVRGYQLARRHNRVRVGDAVLSPWQRAAGASCVNHEISVLGQMLRHCGLWHRIRPYYFPLHVDGWSPRQILTEAEEEALFRTAARHPEASLAWWIATITNNTTASGIELRGLRLGNVFLRDPGEISEIYIPADAVKNSSRPRKIALNPTARWAVAECYKRALRCGSHQPDHYLFPFRVKRNRWAPERPASRFFLRKSWAKLRAATGCADLRPHDLRHHCITRLLESGVEPETVRAIAGHVTPKMMEYYAHHRARVKYAAVMAIERGG